MMGDLAGEELEEPVELFDVAPGLGDERRRVRLRRLECPHLELETVSEALNPSKDVHRVALAETLVQ